MSNTTDVRTPDQQTERLAHIEFMVYFTGKVSRKDIMSRFGVSQAAATRDLSRYIDCAPDNIVYDPRAKQYTITSTFKPLYRLSPDKCLKTLSYGFGDSLKGSAEFAPAYSMGLERPDISTVAAISRAISLKRPVKVEYLSSTSGKSTKVICPHAILDNGLRWHIRAFDRDKSRFADFVMNRIVTTSILNRGGVNPSEMPECDSQWNETAVLVLQPHPKLPSTSKAVIEHEFRMVDGTLQKEVRKAHVGYLLNSWNVDATCTGELEGSHVLLHLQNVSDIENQNIDNLFLAPGRGRQSPPKR
jgi:predicted DNA-binding transcriptional regulator YafY